EFWCNNNCGQRRTRRGLELRNHGRSAIHYSLPVSFPVGEVLEIRNVDYANCADLARIVVHVHEVHALLTKVCTRNTSRRRVWTAKHNRDLAGYIDAFVPVNFFRLNKPTASRENQLT